MQDTREKIPAAKEFVPVQIRINISSREVLEHLCARCGVYLGMCDTTVGPMCCACADVRGVDKSNKHRVPAWIEKVYAELMDWSNL